MKKNYFFPLFAVIILTVFAACTQNNFPTETIYIKPTSIALDEDLGGITGIYQTNFEGETLQLRVYAAQYLGDPDSEGIFIYGKNMEASVPIDNSGFFQISNLTPGFYVLLIGSDIDTVAVHQQNGVARKIEVVANEYTDIGVIN